MAKLQPLEHKVLKMLRTLDLTGQSWALACSGGLDSVALVHCLAKISSSLGISINSVVHIHHGPCAAAQLEFRNQAASLVEALAKKEGIPFIMFKAHEELRQSEAVFRKYRETCFGELLSQQGGPQVVAFAHHSDDLVETQLLQMMRGCGVRGFLAMKKFDAWKVRPFLGLSREELLNYAQETNISWVEDPTNSEKDYLRNWLRNEWLPALHQKSPGAVGSMARSLQNLAHTLGDISKSGWDQPSGPLSRKQFVTMSHMQKQSAIFSYLKELECPSYTQSQIDEVIKRLDTSQKELSFKVLGLDWQINAEHIKAQPIV